jgi:hypothetical protein
MAETIKTGTIFIKDGTLVPETLQLESEPCGTGWRLVKNLDGCGLDRSLQEAGWTFLYLHGEIKGTTFGFDARGNVHKATKRILAALKSGKFNGLEITQVATKRFCGLPYATVRARSRHIQDSLIFLRANLGTPPSSPP